MMHYRISYNNPLSHYIQVTLSFEATTSNLHLKLPAWRPGRYQVQNFAKFIKCVSAQNHEGKDIATKKISKDQWLLKNQEGAITVTYEFYAFRMDAGGSWLDEEQLYLNFINFALYADELIDQPCTIELDIPKEYKVATGLARKGKHLFESSSYYELVDSPLIASASLRQISYEVDEHTFHIWVQGELPRTDEALIGDFRPFTQLQMDIMDGFPSPEYHFLLQCLPYKHYHGVEHHNSTVIAFGPAGELVSRKSYRELLGVSCHELFHAWNVIRIRPAEMCPYDFEKENYHETGFVTEGVTTYYGDLLLTRSRVYSLEEYLAEVNKLLKRHFENDGRKNYSVAESSFDLWLDGYEKGIPGRKVSIYNEGALAAMILDLKIRLKTNHKKSMDDVMQLMWKKHKVGQGGYSYQDYQKATEEVYGGSLQTYFDEIVSGTQSYEKELSPLFEAIGLNFTERPAEKAEERYFGFRILEQQDRYFIDQIATGSPAEKVLSLKDEIIAVNESAFKGELNNESEVLILKVNRFGKEKIINMTKDSRGYFQIFQVKINDITNRHLKQWLSPG